jgi:hypothetical protein
MMTVRPVSLNAAIASLFIVGSALFISNRYRATADGTTYFVGLIFLQQHRSLNLCKPRRQQ